MKKISIIITAILFLTFVFTLNNSVDEVTETRKAYAAPSNIVLESNPSTPTKSGSLQRASLLVHNVTESNVYSEQDLGGYPSYPSTIEYTHPISGPVTEDLRETCNARGDTSKTTTQGPERLPWLAYYPPTFPTADMSNNFKHDDDGSCSNYRLEGGPGRWLSPYWNSWAIPGNYSGDSTGWKSPVRTDNPVKGVNSDRFTDGPKIWKTGKLIEADYDFETSTKIFGANVFPDLHLISAGASFFRMEFDFTDTQWQFINANKTNIELVLTSKADDWQKVYINGLSDSTMEVNYSGGTIASVNKTLDGNALIDTYNLQQYNNVISFQVNDKAVWHQNGASSNSNRAGLWFNIGINFTEPPATPNLSCSVTPQEGLAPLVITATTIATNYSPVPTSFDYRFQRIKNAAGEAVTETAETITGRGSEFYYTLPNAGTYNSWASIGGSNDWKSCEPINVVVTDPSDPDGGEVTP